MLDQADVHEDEQSLFDRLQKQLEQVKSASLHYAKTLATIDPADITDRAALTMLPVLKKSDLIELQETAPPLGGLNTVGPGSMARLFLSPGPIAEVQPVSDGDHWRMSRALLAAGFRPGDRVANGFSYHLTPAGFMFDDALRSIGCAVFPGGTGATDIQVDAINRFELNGYVGTPDFLKLIMERAEQRGAPITSMQRALVTGGPLFPSLRDWYKSQGVDVRQCYGTAELGLIAFEEANHDHGMMVSGGCLLEIVRPGTGQAVPVGEVGEVIVTTFDTTYPLIRLATGDLSALLPTTNGNSTKSRLKGWMGRADQTTKVRGMFVHPGQIARVIAPFPKIARARLEVSEREGSDQLRLLCEIQTPEDGLAERLQEAVRAECRLRGDVDLVALGSLPNDGKVIDDKRNFGV